MGRLGRMHEPEDGVEQLNGGRQEGYLQFKQTLPVIPAVRRQGEVSRELDRPDG